MILSMTGYGSSRLEEGELSLAAEIRGVNNRYLKSTYRIPEFLSPLEADFDRIVRSLVSRGALTVTVRCKMAGVQTRPPISEEAITGYAVELRRIAAKVGLAGDINIGQLLGLPGVFVEDEGQQSELDPIRDRVLATVESALKDFKAMRRREGQALEKDLRDQLQAIRRHLDVIAERTPLVVKEYRDRLLARIAELLKDSPVSLAEDNLLTEVSIFAERSDINEELKRLQSHLDQFDSLLEVNEPAGRKLEFLSQEMLRESNTIGSKSSDTEISKHVVEVKAAIDRIKEQVQNAE